MDSTEPCRIIAFPTRVIAVESDQARLQRSMTSLQQALLEQGDAVAAWRRSIDDLRDGLSTLHGSVQAYRSTVDRLAEQCSPAAR